jgi:hypothetical protein
MEFFGWRVKNLTFFVGGVGVSFKYKYKNLPEPNMSDIFQLTRSSLIFNNLKDALY